MVSARLAAVKALVRVEADSGYSNIVIDSQLTDSGLTEADSALACALFYGVLDRKLSIDYCLQQHLSKPISKLSPFVRQALRIAVCQLFYMDKIPAFAAINESVNIVKRSRDKYAAGLVNAVLRSVQRGGTPSLPEGSLPAAMSLRYSCEEWIVKRLISDYGAECTERILGSFLAAPDTYLKANSVKITTDELISALTDEGVEAYAVDGYPDAVKVKGAVDNTKSYNKGLFHVQDLSSQQCCQALDVREGMRVLDVCAAPGGKSFTLAQLMNSTGEVVSCDLHEHRVELIKSGADRLGLSNITAICADATEFNASLGEFDRVLCDVVCSGIGVIRRKPEIKYKHEFEQAQLSRLQLKILETSSRYLKLGGKLVYSTCTLFKSENENVINEFLSRHSDFEACQPLTTLMPYDDTDGFFYACVQKVR